MTSFSPDFSPTDRLRDYLGQRLSDRPKINYPGEMGTVLPQQCLFFALGNPHFKKVLYLQLSTVNMGIFPYTLLGTTS